MSGNTQKTPFVSTQNAFASRKAQEAINLLGKALPCSVAAIPTPGVPIVTVKFEIQDPTFKTLPNVTVPVVGPEYIRVPLQVPANGKPGTLGVVMSADAYIGGVSGLGGGVADLSQRGNLTTLVFFPIGNKGWQPVADANALVLYGVDGTIIHDTIKNASSILVTPNGITAAAVNNATTITMTNTSVAIVGNTSIRGNLSVTGNVSITGGLTATQDVVAGGISLMNHVHSNSGGTGTGGPPVAGS